jgi:transmembrane sensor
MADNADDRDPTERHASREASGWMIRLQEAPEDVALRRAFEGWRREPVNAAAWDATERMSHAVAGTAPVHAERWGPFLRETRAGAEKGTTATTGLPLRVPERRRAFVLSGLAAAAAIVAVVAGPQLAQHLQADYTTGTAETRTVRLADDSVVTLGPGSAIGVAYMPGERRVRLLAGEAYFEVTPNADRPFQVAAGQIRVTVLGTAFNVNRGEEGADIGVAHGVVRVDYGDAARPAAERLAAGEFVRVSWSGRVTRGEQPPSQAAAWRERQLIAQDQPLGDVVDRLRRYYAGAIVVIDRALGEQPVTGVYNLDNPAGALRAIARSQNAIVRELTPWLLVVSRS